MSMLLADLSLSYYMIPICKLNWDILYALILYMPT